MSRNPEARPDTGLAPHLIAGSACVAAGALAAVHLPPALAGVALALTLLRRCWIEANIHDDLIGAEDLPTGYRNALRRQERLAAFWNLPVETQAPDCPRRLASLLRLQALGLSAFLYGALATGLPVLADAPAALLPGMAALWLGLRRADSYAHARAVLARGDTLPPDRIAHREGLAAWAMNGLAPPPRR